VSAAQRSAALRAHRGPVLLALPTIVFLLVLFAIPVARLMLLSVETGTLEPYEKALTDPLYLKVLLDTGKIALIVTVLCFMLGYPVAYFLTVAPRAWQVVGLFCLLMPFWTSILVRTYAWMVLLGRRGVVSETLLSLGIIDAPMTFLHSLPAVLVGMVHVLLPYLVFPVYAVMQRIDPNLMQAAHGLGAPGWRAFWRVYFPLTMPGVLSGASLVFILSMGFFITPVLLGGGRVMMIAVLIEQQVREFLNWEFAGALSATLLVFTLCVYAAFRRLMGADRQLV